MLKNDSKRGLVLCLKPPEEMSKFIALLFICLNIWTEAAHLNNLEAAHFIKPDMSEHEVPQLTKVALSKPFWLYFVSANKPSYQRHGAELLPRFAECTQSESLTARITRGERAHLKEYPWMALLEYTNGKEKRHFCVGSLINQRYVITAAHCLERHLVLGLWRLSSVRLGEWDTRTNPDCSSNAYDEAFCAPKHIVVMIEQAIPHPLYKSNSKNSINDIALLRLERNVSYNDFISPICLPRSAESNNITYDGTRMAVIGWGRNENSTQSKIKMKASVVGVDAAKCKKFYRRKYVLLTDSHICAVGEGGSDSCKGDSGGPLVVTQTIKKIQIRKIYIKFLNRNRLWKLFAPSVPLHDELFVYYESVEDLVIRGHREIIADEMSGEISRDLCSFLNLTDHQRFAKNRSSITNFTTVRLPTTDIDEMQYLFRLWCVDLMRTAVRYKHKDEFNMLPLFGG
uniref:Peptidase S1 domain-containing protein n=1 Tax=Glossina austeni TaxID=7395 RepID=A0A1A9VIV9_GLOAU